MKKFFLLVTFLIILFGLTQAQSLSGIDLDFTFPDTYNGLILSPSAQFESNKHVWSVGPTILVSYGDQIEQRETMKFSGLYLGYKNFLQGREEKFSVFFALNLWLQRIKDKQRSQFFNTGTSSFESFTIEQTDTIVQFSPSLGVECKISDRFRISQQIGTGFNLTFRKATSPFSDFSDPIINQEWILKTGIGFSLN